MTFSPNVGERYFDIITPFGIKVYRCVSTKSRNTALQKKKKKKESQYGIMNNVVIQ